MRFPPSLLDEIRARLPVSQVVTRKVSLKRSGREMRGLSPFKQEKTPSFFVNDHKGSWFDFSSGQNGDIFKFVMLTDGLSFPEAVERLAVEAGVPMPKPTAREEEREDERTRLYALLDASARFFETQLTAASGQEGRRYLDKRGLGSATIARFRLGYAPNSRSALKDHLAKAGFSTAEMATAGMLITGDDIPVGYDRFRHRVMFPITDMKGRTIAFGGRALEADVPAKYLNSPETPLFHKGHVLFNAGNARSAAFDKHQVIVVEGYMDVIALAEAGFPQTVAPLGTALTEDQVKLLWRLAPEPVLCFDGDGAGRRAAFRAVETVLPHLKPGFSVQFAFLPEGLDPDDLIRQQGADAFRAILDRTSPLFDVLMRREDQREDAALTPERRASVEARLKEQVARIADPGVRSQYESELRTVLWERTRKTSKALAGSDGRRDPRFAGKRRDNTQLDWRIAARAQGKPNTRPPPRQLNPASATVRSNELAERGEMLPAREALLLRTLLNHPWLLETHCEEIAAMPLTSPALTRLRDALLELLARNVTLEREEIRTHLNGSGLDKIVTTAERASTHKSDRFAEPGADPSEAEAGWRHVLSLHETLVGFRQELSAAERIWAADPSEDAWTRIAEAQERLARAAEAEQSGDA
jgi:DNA primase